MSESSGCPTFQKFMADVAPAGFLADMRDFFGRALESKFSEPGAVTIDTFVSAHCDAGPDLKVTFSDLYNEFLRVGGRCPARMFSRQMMARFQLGRKNGNLCVVGLDLKKQNQNPAGTNLLPE